MTLLYHALVTRVNGRQTQSARIERAGEAEMLCCECPAVGEIVAWFDNDPASGVVDELHNPMIDRILTAYEAAWPKERCSRWRKGHMSIWYAQPTLEALRQQATRTMIEHLGIEFLDVGDDYLSARLPVDARSVQPFGILHGGASVALAETLGSAAANWCVNYAEKMCVGLDINANHVRAARSGFVIGTARPLHLGTSTQVWEIRIEDEQARLVCIARLTMAVLNRP